MKLYIKIFFGIFLALSASRFIPHPPNFTSLLALSFYVPALLGRKYIFALLLSFVITDLFIGFHALTFFTWGSVVIIGVTTKYFSNKFTTRLMGAFLGTIIFFIITNFGVWAIGSYGYTFEGLITCYVLAIPFYAYSLISTILFSSIIEIIYKITNNNIKSFKINT